MATDGFQVGSGNVFADLSLPDAGALMLKADLAARLTDSLRAGGVEPRAALTLLGWTQSEVSAFSQGRISGISAERIRQALAKLEKQE